MANETFYDTNRTVGVIETGKDAGQSSEQGSEDQAAPDQGSSGQGASNQAAADQGGAQ